MTRITQTLFAGLLTLELAISAFAQGGHEVAPPPPPGAKSAVCKGRLIPQLEDVTAQTGVHFSHVTSTDKKYIVESMSGGVLLIDYDRDR